MKHLILAGIITGATMALTKSCSDMAQLLEVILWGTDEQVDELCKRILI